jgi:uncharacterized protein YjbI with pentapeptide repeats
VRRALTIALAVALAACEGGFGRSLVGRVPAPDDGGPGRICGEPPPCIPAQRTDPEAFTLLAARLSPEPTDDCDRDGLPDGNDRCVGIFDDPSEPSPCEAALQNCGDLLAGTTTQFRDADLRGCRSPAPVGGAGLDLRGARLGCSRLDLTVTGGGVLDLSNVSMVRAQVTFRTTDETTVRLDEAFVDESVLVFDGPFRLRGEVVTLRDTGLDLTGAAPEDDDLLPQVVLESAEVTGLGLRAPGRSVRIERAVAREPLQIDAAALEVLLSDLTGPRLDVGRLQVDGSALREASVRHRVATFSGGDLVGVRFERCGVARFIGVDLTFVDLPPCDAEEDALLSACDVEGSRLGGGFRMEMGELRQSVVGGNAGALPYLVRDATVASIQICPGAQGAYVGNRLTCIACDDLPPRGDAICLQSNRLEEATCEAAELAPDCRAVDFEVP